MTQAVSRHHVSTEVRFRFLITNCGSYGGQTCNGKGLFYNYFVSLSVLFHHLPVLIYSFSHHRRFVIFVIIDVVKSHT
jgi:hypothetical protein